MKAAVIDGFGAPSEVRIADVGDPLPAPDEVVVRLYAAALNHLDLWTVTGALQIPLDFPHVLGADGAGEIESVGDETRGLQAGRRVVINPGISCGGCERCRAGQQSECADFRLLGEHVPGTFAERVAVPSANVFPIPDHLDWVHASALGVTATTAYRMLFTQGKLTPGEWVLVTGIGGGLGSSLFQLARAVAGRVFVTSSSDDKLQRALEMGADAGINYRSEDVGKAVRRLTGKRGVDLVVDSAGGPTVDASLRALRAGGRLVIAGGTAGREVTFDVRRLFWNQLHIVGSTMGSHSDVSEMLRMVAGLKLVPEVDRTFSLEEAAEALTYLHEQDQFGKVVLTID
ncbi:MAG: zinc-binding dehydrogenase [Actinomycetota bacterium]